MSAKKEDGLYVVGMGGAARDLVGYGASPPHISLPGNAQIAVNIVINYEEGAELSPVDGDEAREITSESVYTVPLGDRDLLQESAYEYGSRVGIWRIMRILDEYDATATVFGCGRALLRNPDVCDAFNDRGYDVVGHGYRWEPHLAMSEEYERTQIRAAIAAIQTATGQRIEGWFTRALPSVNTRRILVEEGLSYDCDSLADDLPYYVRVGDNSHLVVPYSLDVNDIRFWKGSFATGTEWFQYAADAFDTLYSDGRDAPRLLTIGLHPRIIGRPGRAAAFHKLLSYIYSKPGVWVCRRNDFAKLWREQFPLPAVPHPNQLGKGAN